MFLKDIKRFRVNSISQFLTIILNKCFYFVEATPVFQVGDINVKMHKGTFIKSEKRKAIKIHFLQKLYTYLILFNFLNICSLLLNHSSKSANEILKSR